MAKFVDRRRLPIYIFHLPIIKSTKAYEHASNWAISVYHLIALTFSGQDTRLDTDCRWAKPQNFISQKARAEIGGTATTTTTNTESGKSVEKENLWNVERHKLHGGKNKCKVNGANSK